MPLHQLLICGSKILPQIHQFWKTIPAKLANEDPYKARIGRMRLKLAKLQKSHTQSQEIREEGLKEGWEDVDEVLYHQGLPYIPEVICTELISRHHDDPLVGHFDIDKTRELVGRKYYWPSLRRDVEAYVKGCDVWLALKAVKHKPYGDLQTLPVSICRWKDLLMDFMTRLPISSD